MRAVNRKLIIQLEWPNIRSAWFLDIRISTCLRRNLDPSSSQFTCTLHSTSCKLISVTIDNTLTYVGAYVV